MARRSLVPRDERTTVNHEFASVDEFITEYVTNISRSGVFIKSKSPLSVGTRVNLKFTVILDDPEIVEGIGEVVRRSEDPRGMGVVFVELSPVSQNLIARLLTRRSAAAAAASETVRLTKKRKTPPPPPGKKPERP
jgi:uncharacterized protein (TIGR02266 family)